MILIMNTRTDFNYLVARSYYLIGAAELERTLPLFFYLELATRLYFTNDAVTGGGDGKGRIVN